MSILSLVEKSLHQPPEECIFFTYIFEILKVSRKQFLLFPLQNLGRKGSFAAILDFPPSQGGVRKTLHMNTSVMSIVFIEVPHESRHIVHYFNV